MHHDQGRTRHEPHPASSSGFWQWEGVLVRISIAVGKKKNCDQNQHGEERVAERALPSNNQSIITVAL